MNAEIAAALKMPGVMPLEPLRAEAERTKHLYDGKPTLAGSTDLGGYPIVYFGSDEDGTFIHPICRDCATSIVFGDDRDSGITIAGAEAFMEGPDEACEVAWVCHPDVMISSAYGDPEAA